MEFSQSDIMNIAYNNFINKFKNELKYLESNSLIDNNERINTLKNIISKYENNINNENSEEIDEEAIDIIKKSVYKKEWHRLQPYHRLELITEYVDKMKEKKKNKKKILKLLEKAIDEGKLNKKKDVKYNSKNNKIEEILVLKLDEDNEYYLDI